MDMINHNQSVYQVWCGIEFVMSALVNVVTKTFICTRLFLLEKRMKRVAAESSMFRSVLPYRQILALVLESALPFTLIGVAGAITAAFLDPANSASAGALYAFPIVTVLWTNGLVSFSP